VEYLNKSIGQLIKELRVAKRMQQYELAAKAGLSKNYLSEIENENADPSLRALRKIALALDVSMTQIFKESNYEEVGENKSK
jgi:transcriptional regulator with XRE-family HTH domain